MNYSYSSLVIPTNFSQKQKLNIANSGTDFRKKLLLIFMFKSMFLFLLTELNIRSPRGEVFKISEYSTFQDERIKSIAGVTISGYLRSKTF